AGRGPRQSATGGRDPGRHGRPRPGRRGPAADGRGPGAPGGAGESPGAPGTGALLQPRRGRPGGRGGGAHPPGPRGPPARLGRPREAESSLAVALPLFESARASIANPDLRATFLAARRQAYELRIDLLVDLDRGEPAAGYARQALEISEQARARSLLDLLQE